jgi:hypothetical protein
VTRVSVQEEEMRTYGRNVILVLMLACAGIAAADAQSRFRGVTIGFAHHKLGIPFLSNPFGDELYPQFSVAGAYEISSGQVLDMFASPVLKIGNHSSGSPVGTTISLGLDFTPRLAHRSGVFLDGIAGVYYNHIFTRLATYRASSDTISQVRNWGRSHISVDFGLGLGYDLSAHTAIPLRVSVRAATELLYAPSLHFGMLNLLPATSLSAAVQYTPGGQE